MLARHAHPIPRGPIFSSRIRIRVPLGIGASAAGAIALRDGWLQRRRFKVMAVTKDELTLTEIGEDDRTERLKRVK